MFMGIKNIRSWTLALPVSLSCLSWYSCKRNAVLTISAPNLNFEYNGTFEKSIRSTEKKIHILGEGLYWFYDNRSIVQNSIIYFLQITE